MQSTRANDTTFRYGFFSSICTIQINNRRCFRVYCFVVLPARQQDWLPCKTQEVRSNALFISSVANAPQQYSPKLVPTHDSRDTYSRNNNNKHTDEMEGLTVTNVSLSLPLYDNDNDNDNDKAKARLG